MNRDELLKDIKEAHALGDPDLELKLLEKLDAMPKFDEPSTLVGIGKGIADSIRGVGSLVGVPDKYLPEHYAPSDAQISEQAPVGEALGNIAMAAPFAPATLGGAALVGAGTGFAFNPSNVTDRLKSAAGGAVGGLVGGALPYAANIIKHVMAPYAGKASQARIIGNLLKSQIGNSAEPVANRLANYSERIPGLQPTAAEIGDSGGLAAIQRWAEQANMEDYAYRRQANAAARIGAIRNIIGTPDQMASDLAQRKAVTQPLYEAAKNQSVPVDGTLSSLLQRPSMQGSLKQAGDISAERGMPLSLDLTNPTDISGETLHHLKIGLDALRKDPANPVAGEKLRALKDTIDEFEKWREVNIPAYAEAQQKYAELSKPIAQRKIAQALLDKAQSALSEHGNYTKETAEQFAKALRDSTPVVRKATGFKGATFENTMTQEQMGTLKAVAESLNRKVSADELGRGVGSNTFQNINMNNLAQAIGIPSYLSAGLRMVPGVRSVIGAAEAAGNLAYKPAETQMKDMLSQVLLDPKKTAELLRAVNVPTRTEKIIQGSRMLLPTFGIGLVNTAQQQ